MGACVHIMSAIEGMGNTYAYVRVCFVFNLFSLAHPPLIPRQNQLSVHIDATHINCRPPLTHCTLGSRSSRLFCCAPHLPSSMLDCILCVRWSGTGRMRSTHTICVCEWDFGFPLLVWDRMEGSLALLRLFFVQ